MRLSISEILSKTDAIENKDEKVAFLHKNWHPVIGELINIAFNKKVKWQLPKGMPPITHDNTVGSPTRLYHEVKLLYRFYDVADKPPLKIHRMRRESLFMESLQELTPDDAALVVAIKDNAWPYKSLTKKFFEELGIITNG